MYHHIRLASGSSRGGGRDTAVVLFDRTTRLPIDYVRLDQQANGALSAAMGRAEFSASRGVVTTVYAHGANDSTKAFRLFVLGLGQADDRVADALRIAGANLLRAAHAAKVGRLRLLLMAGLDGCLDAAMVGRAVSEGMSIANFQFDAFKGTSRDRKPSHGAIKRIALGLEAEPAIRAGLRRGLSVGESVDLARRLAATPPNVANPSYVVSYCRKMAAGVGLSCSVIDVRKAKRLKMGGLLAVGRAGSKPPALICLEHRPPRAKGRPILLVGKAITFDTGGYSIKPGAGMEGMKYDKCGGMAVIGAMHAVARLKLPVRVVGLVATAENMINEKAYRPGDILTMHNGVTVEVTNTDAEGRLVLGDALAYGCKRFRPAAVIDLATLTGGVVVALGSSCAGAFCNDVKLQDHLLDAAQYTGERLWPLPLWEEHRQQLKGTHGDIVNSAGREAHPIQGAAFLSYFVDPDNHTTLPKTPWAHLDIAGVSDVKSRDHLIYPKGPTGFGVRLLVRAIEMWPSQSGRPSNVKNEFANRQPS